MLAWSKESQVKVYATLHLGPAGPPELSVEGNFACLDGSDEDNRNTFANPLEDSLLNFPQIKDLDK
jgi:hypothetical protein